MHLQIPWK